MVVGDRVSSIHVSSYTPRSFDSNALVTTRRYDGLAGSRRRHRRRVEETWLRRFFRKQLENWPEYRKFEFPKNKSIRSRTVASSARLVGLNSGVSSFGGLSASLNKLQRFLSRDLRRRLVASSSARRERMERRRRYVARRERFTLDRVERRDTIERSRDAFDVAVSHTRLFAVHLFG